MAMKRSYEDQYGNSYTDSYWRIVQINVGVADRTANIVFYGYKDAASREANKQSIGSKSYSVSGAVFDQMMAQHLADKGPNIMALAYQYAKKTKDVVVDPQDTSKNVSFFADAIDV